MLLIEMFAQAECVRVLEMSEVGIYGGQNSGYVDILNFLPVEVFEGHFHLMELCPAILGHATARKSMGWLHYIPDPIYSRGYRRQFPFVAIELEPKPFLDKAGYLSFPVLEYVPVFME